MVSLIILMLSVVEAFSGSYVFFADVILLSLLT